MNHIVGANLTVRNHLYSHTTASTLLVLQPSRNIAVDIRNACFALYINLVHLVSAVQLFVMPYGTLQFTLPAHTVYTHTCNVLLM